MADFLLIVVATFGSFALLAALVVGCERIVKQDDADHAPASEVTE
ncbi:MAG: hypothetical protein JWL73_2457 [Actinomycetia bacterium]|nr:hypothetical protein [Actinomycetes bacterium]